MDRSEWSVARRAPRRSIEISITDRQVRAIHNQENSLVALLAELAQASEDDFGADPGAVLWGGTAQGWTLVAEHSDIASGKDDRRAGFQAALLRCRQLGAILVAAWLDRITRRAHTLSQRLKDGVSIRAADMPGADDLMMRIYAGLAPKERGLISERTRAALASAKACGTALGGG